MDNKKSLYMNPEQIASLIGTVGSPLIVISELIKNAVDASADNIDIFYNSDDNNIIIRNDACGFDLKSIENLSEPGTSNKKVSGNLKNKKGMYLTGSKGLGLLSAFLITDLIEIETVSNELDIYKICYHKKDGTIEYQNTKVKSDEIYTEIVLTGVENEVLEFLSSPSELKKLRHICTNLYKNNEVPFPIMNLHIGDNLYKINFDCKIPDMLYSVSFNYDKISQNLFFKCISNKEYINSNEIIINDFRTQNLHKILRDAYNIHDGILNTRTNDDYPYSNVDNVPSFEGKIYVYEKRMAGEELQGYGPGVNIYINDFALYNYLSEENDWLGLADFSQRKKVTRLKPHNVFGYVNLMCFDENTEKLKISNERAGFIEDITFKKMMYLLKAVVLFLIINIDVADKNSKIQFANGQESIDDKKIDSNVDTSNKKLDGKDDTNNSVTSRMSSNGSQKTENNDSCSNEKKKYFIPSPNVTKKFVFTKENEYAINGLKGVNNLSNKIYEVVYELSRIEPDNYKYSVACLIRILIESASNMYINRYNVKIGNEKSLEHRVISVLNDLAQYAKKTTVPSDKNVKLWRESLVKSNFIDTLNEYIHNDTQVDMYLLREKWKSVEPYVICCISLKK